MADQRTTTAFTQALNTINMALDRHSGELPYKQIIAAGEKLLGDRRLGVGVYKDEASKPYDYYTLKFENGAFQIVSHGKEDTDLSSVVSKAYLEDVAQNPERYIDKPYKLDLEWLKSRLGVH
jgi:hypothetical protein